MSIAPTTPRPVTASVTASTSQAWRRTAARERSHSGWGGWLGLAAHSERTRAAAERERVTGHGRVASLGKYGAGLHDRAHAHRKGDTVTPPGAAHLNSLPDDRIARRGRARLGPHPWSVS